MRAKEYNAIRESWNKTQLEMAPVLSVSKRTAQNYAAKGVTGPAKRLIEALQAMPAKLRDAFLAKKEG